MDKSEDKYFMFCSKCKTRLVTQRVEIQQGHVIFMKCPNKLCREFREPDEGLGLRTGR